MKPYLQTKNSTEPLNKTQNMFLEQNMFGSRYRDSQPIFGLFYCIHVFVKLLYSLHQRLLQVQIVYFIFQPYDLGFKSYL